MDPNRDLTDEAAAAPRLAIPSTTIVAIEHPSPVYNVEAGLRSFGPQPKFDKLLLPTTEPHALPLWFRPDNPAAKPITSHHAASNNVLLKITVPRRTGRKRKRGSTGPFQNEENDAAVPPRASYGNRISSVNRQDKPKSILRRLQDNADDYRVEAVGMIYDSHRYRGLADFQFANSDKPFLTNVAEHLLPLDPTKFRAFKLRSGMTSKPGDDIIPPPHFTDRTVPFFYQYEQNPLVKIEGLDEHGEPLFVNVQGKNMLTYGHFIPTDHFPVPEGPKGIDSEAVTVKDSVLQPIRKAFEERPIWTRRALSNRLRDLVSENQMKIGIPLVGYQFRGGPWRDAVIKYGIDPRDDPHYRVYQTLQFKLVRNVVGQTKLPWQTIRKGQTKHYAPDNVHSHLWDGESYSTDGKFWQICDITDPFLKRMLDEAPVRPTCDLAESGWYYKAFWSKIKMFMKAKMVAIKHGRMGNDNDEPRRDNYIYNSYLEARLRNIPNDTDDKVNPVLNPLLYPMSDIKGFVGRWRQSKLFPDQHGSQVIASEEASDQPDPDLTQVGEDGPDWDEEVASGGEDEDDDDEDDDDNDEQRNARSRIGDHAEDEEGEEEDEDDDDPDPEDEEDDDAGPDDNTLASNSAQWTENAGSEDEDYGQAGEGDEEDVSMNV